MQIIRISHILFEILFEKLLFVCLGMFYNISAWHNSQLIMVFVIEGGLTYFVIQLIDVFTCHPILKSLLYKLESLEFFRELTCTFAYLFSCVLCYSHVWIFLHYLFLLLNRNLNLLLSLSFWC